MVKSLTETLQILKNYQPELRRRGVMHAAVFGSVARGEATVDSDIDILIEVDSSRAMGVFAYASLESYINELLGGSADVVNRKTLKPLLQDAILRDAVDAF
jgi:predicted nucleotidyltransferase